MSSCLKRFCMAVGDAFDTNSSKSTLNPEPEGAEIFIIYFLRECLVCVCVWLVYSHIEEVESYTVEAFAVCVSRQGR